METKQILVIRWKISEEYKTGESSSSQLSLLSLSEFFLFHPYNSHIFYIYISWKNLRKMTSHVNKFTTIHKSKIYSPAEFETLCNKLVKGDVLAKNQFQANRDNTEIVKKLQATGI